MPDMSTAQTTNPHKTNVVAGVVRLIAVAMLAIPFVSKASTVPTESEVTIAWDKSPGSKIVGYHVHSGPKGGEFDQVDDVGNQTSVRVRVNSGEPRRFAVSAYTASGKESPISEDITYSYTVEDKSTADAAKDVIRVSAEKKGGKTQEPVTVAWQQISGPGSVEISDASALETSFSFETPGTYALELTTSSETEYSKKVIILPVVDTSVAIASAVVEEVVAEPGVAPTVKVAGKKKLAVSRPRVIFRGEAQGGVTQVICHVVGENRQVVAKGTNNWRVALNLKSKHSRLRFFAVGPDGVSAGAKVVVSREG